LGEAGEPSLVPEMSALYPRLSILTYHHSFSPTSRLTNNDPQRSVTGPSQLDQNGLHDAVVPGRHPTWRSSPNINLRSFSNAPSYFLGQKPLLLSVARSRQGMHIGRGSTACCYLPTRGEEDVYMYIRPTLLPEATLPPGTCPAGPPATSV
jgi:hypothetical protein